MSESTTQAEIHVDHFPSARVQSWAASVGMWLFLATELMFFGPLFFAYAYGRLGFSMAMVAAAGRTDMALGTANIALLLTSSLLMADAVAAMEKGNRRVSRLLLAGTALLGITFLVLKGIEYRDDWHKGLLPTTAGTALPPEARYFFLLYFVMTGVHALHLAVGIGLVLAFVWALAPEASARATSSRLRVLGLYWHFVDVVWIFLYPLLYLPGRNA